MRRRASTAVVTALIVSSVVLGLLTAAAEPPTGVTTVFLVRHAEKNPGGSDPVLNARGSARAAVLARVLADAGIDAVYSSQYRRTRQTAQPLVEQLGIETRVDTIDGADITGWAREFADRLRSAHRGRSVLVTGHSNTVPMMIEALGAGPAPAISEHAYDDLFVVTIRGDDVNLLHLHYGASSPDPEP